MNAHRDVCVEQPLIAGIGGTIADGSAHLLSHVAINAWWTGHEEGRRPYLTH